MKVTVDGIEQSEKTILLVDDGQEHKVEVWAAENCRKKCLLKTPSRQ
jgi:hypothetical protein